MIPWNQYLDYLGCAPIQAQVWASVGCRGKRHAASYLLALQYLELYLQELCTLPKHPRQPSFLHCCTFERSLASGIRSNPAWSGLTQCDAAEVAVSAEQSRPRWSGPSQCLQL